MEKLPALGANLLIEKLPTLRVTLFYNSPSMTLFMEELSTLRVTLRIEKNLYSTSHYHPDITLAMEELPTLRIISPTLDAGIQTADPASIL